MNGSVNFKLPDLNYDVNQRRATNTHRYESVKARGNKNQDSKETLTKEMVILSFKDPQGPYLKLTTPETIKILHF